MLSLPSFFNGTDRKWSDVVQAMTDTFSSAAPVLYAVVGAALAFFLLAGLMWVIKRSRGDI